eukprot:CAMPEP_0114662444 /NCGR_PEP_ID=MMETSP0191-20121206/24853_1 /TAXON_ID=126664 /ORGANISM="Sorites sp." /LENGTH=76 /DNA_ID=CAMNT_0001898671 /DNA_START=748 /DNA_END=978 /DNA_ORIENTATION=-
MDDIRNNLLGAVRQPKQSLQILRQEISKIRDDSPNNNDNNMDNNNDNNNDINDNNNDDDGSTTESDYDDDMKAEIP